MRDNLAPIPDSHRPGAGVWRSTTWPRPAETAYHDEDADISRAAGRRMRSRALGRRRGVKTTQEATMNGAEAILRTLANNDVEACFSNPGTSEMQLVAAFDHESTVRPVLCLFEGVATGAADGYARIAGTPPATFLHLAPLLSNRSSTLHTPRLPIP